MRALDYPAMPSKPLLAFHTSTSDTGHDATLLQVTPTASKVVSLVRMQFARAFAGLAIQARHCGNGIERGLDCDRIVPVGPGTVTPGGMPRASTTMCRCDPSLPSTSGWGRFLAPGGWKRWRHRCLPVPNQSDRAHATGEASPDAV